MNLFDVLFSKKLAGGGDYPAIIKRVTGNPVEFTDGASAPLIECKSEIQGSQDLHGYDKPWVGGAGKNKLIDSGYVQGVLGLNETTAESIVANTHFITSPYMPINNNTAYTMSAIHGNIVRIYVTDENHNTLYFRGNNPIEGNNEIIPATSGAVYCRVSIGIDDEAVIPSDYGTKVYGQLELGSTATPYEPYSNICPITAYTEGEIEVRGKNVLSTDTLTYNIAYSGYQFFVFNDKKPNTEYTIAFISDKAFNCKGLWTTTPNTAYNIVVGQNIIRYKTTSDIQENYKMFYVTGTEPGNITFTNCFIAESYISDSDYQYEPYTSTTHTTTYPSAIYRGSEDVVNGEVTSEWRFLEFDGSLDENWSYNNNNALWRITIPNAFIVTSQTQRNVYTVNNLFEDKGWADRNGNGTVGLFYGESQLYLKYAQITTEVDLRAFLSTNPLQVAYQLATPTTSSVTPTNLPIKSLSGYNHIESSTGDLDITYITEGYQEFVDEIESTYGRRKGGKKPIDVFRMLEGDSEPKEEEEKEDKK